MIEEVEYGSKKKHVIDMIIIIGSYYFLMFYLPQFLADNGIARVNNGRWNVIGDVNEAFWIYVGVEFALALFIGLFTRKSRVYKIMIISSFLIKIVVYVLYSVFLLYFKQFFITDFSVFVTRIVLAYNAYNGVFLPSIIIPMPTLLGLEIGKLFKNKIQERKIKRRNYASKSWKIRWFR